MSNETASEKSTSNQRLGLVPSSVATRPLCRPRDLRPPAPTLLIIALCLATALVRPARCEDRRAQHEVEQEGDVLILKHKQSPNVDAEGPQSFDFRVTSSRTDPSSVSTGGQGHPSAFLGVVLLELTEPLRAFFEVPSDLGVLVAEVVAESPAAQVLEAGDVLTHVDRQPIRSSYELRRTIAEAKPEQTLLLERWRQGTMKAVDVQLGSRRKSRIDVSRLLIKQRNPEADPLTRAGQGARYGNRVEHHGETLRIRSRTEGPRLEINQTEELSEDYELQLDGSNQVWVTTTRGGENVRIEIDGRAVESATQSLHTLLNRQAPGELEQRLKALEKRMERLARELDQCKQEGSK